MNNIKKFVNQNALIIGAAMLVMAISFAAVYTYTSNRSSSQVANAATCDATSCVSLEKGEAVPSVLTITNGSTVQFNSADGGKHNLFLSHSAAQHDDESRYESGDFNEDEAWKVQFDKDGTYTFADKYNENTSINVVVYTEGKDYKVN